MANIGELNVLLKADDQASAKLSQANSSLKTQVQQVGKQYAILGGAIATAVGGAMMTFIATGDKLEKMSRQTGISVEALDNLNFVAELSGTNLQGMATAVRGLNTNLISAQEGSVRYVKAFEDLGFAVDDVVKMDAEERVFTLLEALAQVDDQTQQTSLAMQVFGTRMGMQLLPVIDGGVEAFREMNTEAKENQRFTTESAQMSALLQDEIFRLKTQMQLVTFEIAKAFAPAMVVLTDKLKIIIPFILRMGELVGNLPTLLVAVVVGVKALRTALLLMQGQVTLMTGGLNLLFGALAVIVTWFLTTEQAGDKVFNMFARLFNWINDRINPILKFYINVWVDTINAMIKGANVILKVIGKDTIPLLEKWSGENIKLKEITETVTEKTADQTKVLEKHNEKTAEATGVLVKHNDQLKITAEATGVIATGYSDMDDALDGLNKTIEANKKKVETPKVGGGGGGGSAGGFNFPTFNPTGGATHPFGVSGSGFGPRATQLAQEIALANAQLESNKAKQVNITINGAVSNSNKALANSIRETVNNGGTLQEG